MDFEKKLERLEEIVTKMESGDLSLDESLKLFEEGIKSSRECHKQLTEDVWSTFASIFTVGSSHQGTIKRIDGKGAIVELEYGVEGNVPSKHLKVEEGKDLYFHQSPQECPNHFVLSCLYYYSFRFMLKFGRKLSIWALR